MTGEIVVSSVPFSRGAGIIQARGVTLPGSPRVADLTFWAVARWNPEFLRATREWCLTTI